MVIPFLATLSPNPQSIAVRHSPFARLRPLPDYVIVDCYHHIAIDDPRKVVKVVASDGKTGDTRDISYTNCKVIGNGSFGVVFQAKLVAEHESGDDIAIKKVLQDKRFKVSGNQLSCGLEMVIMFQIRIHRAEP
jgi:hypothetical protein